MAGGFGVTMQIKNLFFDRANVIRQIGRAKARALSKAGAFIRRRARSSMRRRKAPSAPGSPPSAHSKDPVATLKNILFAYEPQQQSVVIGPVWLNQVNNLWTGSRATVPAIHEFGGTVGILEVSHDRGRTWRRWDRRRNRRPNEMYRRRQAHYPQRAFMGPALQAEIPNFPSLWTTNRAGAA